MGPEGDRCCCTWLSGPFCGVLGVCGWLGVDRRSLLSSNGLPHEAFLLSSAGALSGGSPSSALLSTPAAGGQGEETVLPLGCCISRGNVVTGLWRWHPEISNANNTVTEPPAFPRERSLSAFPVVVTTGWTEPAQRFHEQCSLPFFQQMERLPSEAAELALFGFAV